MNNFLILLKDNFLTSLRTKKAILFLILYLGVFWLIIYGIIKTQAEIYAKFSEQRISQEHQRIITGFARNFLRSNSGENVELVNFLLSVSFFNIALFCVTIFGTPLLILILKYDVVTQEFYDKTLRFLTPRVARWKIILAKFFSGFLEISVFTFLAFLVGIFLANVNLSDFDLTKSFRAGIWFWGVSQAFLMVFLSFAIFISTVVKKPFFALLFSIIGNLFFLIIPSWINFLSPFDMKFIVGLFHDFSAELWYSILVYLVFSVVFLSGAIFIFNRKNL